MNQSKHNFKIYVIIISILMIVFDTKINHKIILGGWQQLTHCKSIKQAINYNEIEWSSRLLWTPRILIFLDKLSF